MLEGVIILGEKPLTRTKVEGRVKCLKNGKSAVKCEVIGEVTKNDKRRLKLK